MSILLWLLLPVAAAAGWFAARRSMVRRGEALWDYSNNFHKGLNVLLNERQGQPVELFDNLPGSNRDAARDTADTHLALGNLFRRRGEVDRAILLHESLLDKAELGADVQATARFELARDYASAGLLDRSEAAFATLIASGHRVQDAYEHLLQLHEREGDWMQAIQVATEMTRDTGQQHGNLIAHYYCELSARARSSGYADEAADLLDKALSHCGDCARANLMLAELALANDNHTEALERYALVEAQRPELMPEIIEDRFKAFEGLGDATRLDAFITHIRGRRNAYSVIRTTRAVIERRDGAVAADRFFKEQVLKRPSLKGLRDWVHDQLPLSRPGEREKVQIIHQLLDQVMEDKPAYQCGECGFQGNVMHWRCPSCGTWDSVHTIIGLEGE